MLLLAPRTASDTTYSGGRTLSATRPGAAGLFFSDPEGDGCHYSQYSNLLILLRWFPVVGMRGVSRNRYDETK